MAIPINFTADPLPDDFSGSLSDFQTRFLLNLRGTITDTNVLQGQIGGAQPSTNIGPWLNNGTWYVWNGATYVPTTVKVGSANFAVTLVPQLVSGVAHIQQLQDKDGTVALLSDVYQGQPTVVLTTITPIVDWSAGHYFSETLSGNTTVSMINSLDGQRIVIAFTNSGTSYTVSWPSYINWSGGSAPTQTANKTDLYIIYNILGSFIGRQIANF